MTLLYRVRAQWSGFTGGPGFTVLHFRDFDSPDATDGSIDAAGAQGAVDRTRTFFDAIKGVLSDKVRIDIDPTVDVLEDTNGKLQDSLSTAATLPVAGTLAGAYSAASGAVINWRTAGVREGRRVRGRSFLVPLGGAAFSNTGQLTPATQTTLQTAASALAAITGTPDLVVYARPTPADKATGAPQIDNGVVHVVTSAQVPTKGAILRSRRD